MLFAFLRSPVDDRRNYRSAYGVPVTFGQDKLVGEILKLLDEFQIEFERKQTFVGVESTLFNAENKLPPGGLFKTFSTDNDEFFKEFSPAIRQISYIEGINFKLGLLEKAIGLSRGILTDLETHKATATEIKRATADTFNMVDAMRRNVEKAVGDYVAACDAIATANGLAPPGTYKLSFDWSYSLLEDSTETFSQMLQAIAVGAKSPAELRAWMDDTSLEQAQATMPETDTLLPPGTRPMMGANARAGA